MNCTLFALTAMLIYKQIPTLYALKSLNNYQYAVKWYTTSLNY